MQVIHEIDSVGENSKLLKAEGNPEVEYFPGLVAGALSGILQIALERGAVAPTAQDRTPSARAPRRSRA